MVQDSPIATRLYGTFLSPPQRVHAAHRQPHRVLGPVILLCGRLSVPWQRWGVGSTGANFGGLGLGRRKGTPTSPITGEPAEPNAAQGAAELLQPQGSRGESRNVSGEHCEHWCWSYSDAGNVGRRMATMRIRTARANRLLFASLIEVPTVN
ncbi:hypothetical protein EI94DRAFT_1727696 [Lactarius quietus]|nr:hypothetical protein EI94DRAFT_1727696 [Lactarius quietus]